MNLEHRKIELINWITTINSQDLLDKMESLKKENDTLPSEILDLLNKSSKDSKKTIHTSAKDLIS